MSESIREIQFENLWNILYPDQEGVWISQSRFDLERDWRFDKAVISKLLAVEIHGGGYKQGRHNREAGMSGDFEKHNAASALGWRVLYLTTSMLENDPVTFFKPIRSLHDSLILSEDAEYNCWTARIANLNEVGATITSNGITVTRQKRNTFKLGLSGKEYSTSAQRYLIDGQREALNMILKGHSQAATPVKLRSVPRASRQLAFF
jgi:hypothetical protein